MSQLEKQMLALVLLSAGQRYHFLRVKVRAFYKAKETLSPSSMPKNGFVTAYAKHFHGSLSLWDKVSTSLHDKWGSSSSSFSPAWPHSSTFLQLPLPVLYSLYSRNTQLPTVPEHPVLSPIPEAFHMMFSLLGIPSTACAPGKPTPCLQVTDEMLVLLQSFLSLPQTHFRFSSPLSQSHWCNDLTLMQLFVGLSPH